MDAAADESASVCGESASVFVRARAPRSRVGLHTGVMGKAATPAVQMNSSNQAIAKLVSMKEQGTRLQVNLEKMLSLPKAVQGKVRVELRGQGQKICECGLCGCSSNTDDPVLGPGVYLLWAHLEGDGITICGNICWVCSSVLRRRYKGWKQAELKLHLGEVNGHGERAHRAQFMAWRQKDIEFLLANGFIMMMNHTSDGGVDRSKVVIKQTKQMLETIDLGKDILWERHAFIAHFKINPEDAGKVEERKDLPDGRVLCGFRVPDDGQRPLPEGAWPMLKQYQVVVGAQTSQVQDQDGDKQQLKANLKVFTNRNMGNSSTDDSLDAESLRILAKNKRRIEDTEAGCQNTLQDDAQESDVDMLDRDCQPGRKREARAGSRSDPQQEIQARVPKLRAVDQSPQGSGPSSPSSSQGLGQLRQQGAVKTSVRRRTLDEVLSAQPEPVECRPEKLAKTIGMGDVADSASKNQWLGKAKISKASSAKVSAVQKIITEITEKYNETEQKWLDASFNTSKCDEFVAEVSSKITLFGKKKGALKSSQMFDDLETCHSFIQKLTAIKKALQALIAFERQRGKTTGLALISATEDLPQSDVAAIPSVALASMDAKAFLEFAVGQYQKAAAALELAKIQVSTGDVKLAEELQLGFLKRCFASFLERADAQAWDVSSTADTISPFVDGLSEQPAGWCQLAQEVLSHAKNFLRPESATREGITRSIGAIQAIEALRSFKIYDSGLALQRRAEETQQKLASLDGDVETTSD